MTQQRKVAVIGGGVAGITAAYQLQNIHEVTLFEMNRYVGGHTNTITIPSGPDAGTPVDTGFIVLNDRTYPLFNRLLERLGVAIRKSDMSFSYFCEKSGFQFGSSNVNSLFAQRRNLISPSYWAMLAEIVKFNTKATRKLAAGELEAITLGAFLGTHNFSRRFKDQYLFPMVAAIWSAPEVEVDRFPMLSFARFFENHGLLTVNRHPQWYFVAGGSQTYVHAFLSQFPGKVRTDSPIKAVKRLEDGVLVKTEDGHAHRFDNVVIATHADEALALLEDPSREEKRLLGAWRYSVNETYLHTDTRWMPTNPRAWASWNFIRVAKSGAADPITLTYDMNRLQQLLTHHNYLVTLNPAQPIDRSHIITRMTYTHPVYTFDSMDTQADLPKLNGKNNTGFCGSYFGYGFHEDAVRSGVQAAATLGADHEL